MALQPVTFLVPDSSAEPVEVDVAHSGLRMVLVNRESIHLLGDEWKVLGIYFLLGPTESDPDRYRAYVGEVGRATLVRRARHHAKRKDWWNRALLVAGSSESGFDSAEIGWLEGRLYDVLNNAVSCEVVNANRPGDNSLPSHRRDVLERYVDPVMAALRACGASPDTADQKPAPTGRKRMTVHPESVRDLLDAGLLKADTVLQPLKTGAAGSARVAPDGLLEVDGVMHATLSAAAKAVTGAASESGWEFWGAPSGDGGFVPLSRLRERLREGKTTIDAQSTQAAEPAARTEGTTGLIDLVSAVGFPLPLLLHARYRGHLLEALIAADGSVVYNGRSYRSLSTAASAARAEFGYRGTRRRPATNGWSFWHYTDEDGSTYSMKHLRESCSDRAE